MIDKLNNLLEKLAGPQFNLREAATNLGMSGVTVSELRKATTLRSRVDKILRRTPYSYSEMLCSTLDAYIWIFENYLGIRDDISRERIAELTTVNQVIFEFRYRVKHGIEQTMELLAKGNSQPNEIKKFANTVAYGESVIIKPYYNRLKVTKLHNQLPIKINCLSEAADASLKDIFNEIGPYTLCLSYYLEGDSLVILRGKGYKNLTFKKFISISGYIVAGKYAVKVSNV